MKLAPHFCFFVVLEESEDRLSTICMAAYNFTKSFFFPKDEDGSISLSTIQQRIEQAMLNIKSPEDYIELEDGTKCFTKNELEKALLSEKSDKPIKKHHAKWGIDKIVLLIVTILFFVLFILGLCDSEFDTLRLIAAILGIVVPCFLLKKAKPSMQWTTFFKLTIVGSSLNLLVSILGFAPVPGEILRALNGIGYIFFIVGCINIYRAQKKFIAAVPFLLLIIPCVFYIVYMTMVTINFDEDIIVGLSIVRDEMYAIKFGLVAICSFIVFKNPAILSSSERYKYGFKSWLILLIAAALTAVWSISDYYGYQDYLEYQSSRPHYKGIHAALNDGSISYGMSYSEIENICGPADRISRTNGVVEFAYYGGYDGVQLVFRNGRYDHWNE